MTDNIHAPLLKAGTAIGAGGGASAVNLVVTTAEEVAGRSSFLPTTLGEYLAAGSATLAIIYTAALFIEWLWKKIVRGGFAK